MSKVTVFNHPLIDHKLSIIRCAKTNTKDFRETVSEIASLMAYEVTRDLKTKDIETVTPIQATITKTLAEEVVIVPILWKNMQKPLQSKPFHYCISTPYLQFQCRQHAQSKKYIVFLLFQIHHRHPHLLKQIHKSYPPIVFQTLALLFHHTKTQNILPAFLLAGTLHYSL